MGKGLVGEKSLSRVPLILTHSIFASAATFFFYLMKFCLKFNCAASSEQERQRLSRISKPSIL